MIITLKNSRWMKFAAFTMLLGITSLAFPYQSFAYDPNKPKPAKPAEPVKSRVLSADELDELSGKTSYSVGNPYYAGKNKYDTYYKGVNVRTGDFTMSATDLNFEGGYGIPVNITRSYSANAVRDEGPFGHGWNFSADLRSTAGAELKSGGAPVRSVPDNIRQKPSMEVDPNSPFDPVEAVILTDSSGQQETVQRDVDGILTTPAWDKNLHNPVYEKVEDNGVTKWILISHQTLTPEGMVYQYDVQGSYDTGVVAWDNTDPNPDPEVSNVLKVSWVEDRHGNRTDYTYGSQSVNFLKSNGATTEYPLIQVDMPNGRTININWTINIAGTKDRITSVTDGSRTVEYLYTDYFGNLELSSIKSPGQRITTYGYGKVVNSLGALLSESPYVLTSITDPRGLQTTIHYSASNDANSNKVIGVYKIVAPNTLHTYFVRDMQDPYWADTPAGMGDPLLVGDNMMERIGGLTGTVMNYEEFWNGLDTSNGFLIQTVGGYSNATAAVWKWFNMTNWDLKIEETFFQGTDTSDRNPVAPGSNNHVRVERDYNFMGNPLKEITNETRHTYTGVETSIRQTDTAYWGSDKYFAQKGTREKLGSQAYRFSFVDVYDDDAQQGRKGQIYRAYSDTNSGVTINMAATVPGYAPTDDYWKYQIESNVGFHDSEFTYDNEGRIEGIWKLQKTSPSYQYVYTLSTYGSDGAPSYGNAVIVTEDSGGINRQTQTLEFDVSGRSIKTLDAIGRQFETDYDLDGNLLSISRIDTQTVTPLVSYVYGTTQGTIENGQPVLVTDNLTGVQQSVSYYQYSDGPVVQGLPKTISEVNGIDSYSMTYNYNSTGDREYATYNIGGQITKWHYKDYSTYGIGTSPVRIFSRLNRMDLVGAIWEESGEEFGYGFDDMGRLWTSYFAQSPQAGQSNYETYSADSRALAVYDYDESGRALGVWHYWQELDNGQYVTNNIQASTATYNHDLALKDSTSFYSGSGTSFVLDRTENYSYDNNTDWLVAVDYNDGLPNEVIAWSYDAAGNRISDTSKPGVWTYDNLNRLISSPDFSYTNDLIGNRVSRTIGSEAFVWDDTNRLNNYSSGPNDNSNYQYRADGMRVTKSHTDLNASTITKYAYDGQMGVYDKKVITPIIGAATTIETSYGNGMRGIDLISRVVDGGSEYLSFPLYDVQGNMISTLSRSGATFTIGNTRSYDVWGGERSGFSTEDQGYVAGLGHRSDDESSLIYMRSRYYDKYSARFISEDKSMDGGNWFMYARNMPTMTADSSGNSLIGKILQAVIFGTLYGFIDLIGGIMGVDLPKIPNMMLKVISAYYSMKAAYALGDALIVAGDVVLVGSGGLSGGLGAGFAMVGLAAKVSGALIKFGVIISFALLLRDLYLIAIDEDQQAWW